MSQLLPSDDLFAPISPAEGTFRQPQQTPTFDPYEPPETKPSRTAWIVLGVCLTLVVGGVVWNVVKPRDAQAQAKVVAPDYKKMTAQQLAIDASASAARELSQRMVNGTEAEQADAADALQQNPSPRLARNFAMAMAIENRKRVQQMKVQIEREQRMAEEGSYEEGPSPYQR